MKKNKTILSKDFDLYFKVSQDINQIMCKMVDKNPEIYTDKIWHHICQVSVYLNDELVKMVQELDKNNEVSACK